MTRERAVDDGYRLYGSAYLMQLAADIAGECDGVMQGTDPEYIHRMRVASRRLRAALPLFADCFPKNSYDKWTHEVKLITRSLGRARDLDVQIAYLRRYADSLSTEALPYGTPRFLPENYQTPLAPKELLSTQIIEQASSPATVSAPERKLSLFQRLRRFFAGSVDTEPEPEQEPETVTDVLPQDSESRSTAEFRSGVECLILRLMQERTSLQPTVIQAVMRFSRSKTSESIISICREVVVRGGMEQIETKTPYAYREAYYQINLCRESLFLYADALEDRDRVQSHHEMRIAAKKLRYTMEVYRELYGDGLSTPIGMVKELQDFLGEMHDCDVWITYLPEFLSSEEAKARDYFGNCRFMDEIRPGISGLLADRSRTRGEIYEKTLSFWKKTPGSWDLLEKSLEKPLHDLRLRSVTIPRGKASIAFFADVHANLPALNAVIRDAQSRGAELFVSDGDAIGFGPFPEETLVRLREVGAFSVAGNAEVAILASGGVGPMPDGVNEDCLALHKKTWKRLSDQSRAEVAALPSELRFNWDGVRVVVVHNPTIPIACDTSDSDLERICQEIDADLIVAGHTHRPFARVVHGVRVVNTGGCGRCGDGDLRASYLLVTREPLTVHIIRVPYDLGAVTTPLAKQKKSKIPLYMFEYGVSCEKAAAASAGDEPPQVSMPDATTVESC